MKGQKEKSMVIGMLLIFGILMIATTAALDKVYAQANSTLNQGQTNSTLNQGQTNSTLNQGQTNSTLNQTNVPSNAPTTITSPQKEASQSIKGAITETGEFVGNVTQKIVSSKSAGTILNETSEVLGDAYVETKKFFSPN
jgi:predicted PurR-regulated permease PerM